MLSMILLAWEIAAIVCWLAHSLVLPFLVIGIRIDVFQSCGTGWVFQICWHNECKTLMASSVGVKTLSRVQPFATPWTVYSLPGSSIHGIFQARLLEWVAIAFSGNYSRTIQIPKGGCHQGFVFIMLANPGRPSTDHSTGKCQLLSPLPKKVVPKNVLTIRQLHTLPMLVRSCLKSCMLAISILQTKSIQRSNLGLEKEEELEIKLLTFTGL